MPERQKIEKPWCIYGKYPKEEKIGKIIEESDNGIFVKFSENQLYSPTWLWSESPLKRFETIQEAFKKLIELKTRSIKVCFPSEFKEDSV